MQLATNGLWFMLKATPCDSVLVLGPDELHLLNDDPGAGIAGLGGCGSLLGVLQLQQVCARGRCAIGRGMNVGKHRLVATELNQSYHCTSHIHLQQDTHISGHTSLVPSARPQPSSCICTWSLLLVSGNW